MYMYLVREYLVQGSKMHQTVDKILKPKFVY